MLPGDCKPFWTVSDAQNRVAVTNYTDSKPFEIMQNISIHRYATWLSFLILLVNLVGCHAPSKQHSNLKQLNLLVKTVNGHSVTLADLRNIHFPELPTAKQIESRSDSAGNPRHQMLSWPKTAIVEDVIPLKIGHGFGFDFQCPKVELNDELVLDVQIFLPGAEQPISTTYRYTTNNSDRYTFIVWGFRKDRPDYLVSGSWKIQVFNHSKEVHSHAFQVISDEAVNRN